jgi:TIR domain
MKVFINYRREDDPHVVDRIRDSLVDVFGEGNVFIDIDTIPKGQNFRDRLKDALDHCDVMLSVIGPRWRVSRS